MSSINASDLKQPARPEPAPIIRVIANGYAANHQQLRTVVAHVRERGHRVEVRVTWEPGDARRYAAEAANAGIATVVAAGGDGTLHEVVNGVVDAGAPARSAIGVLPLGTANDFATACGIPTADLI